MRKTKIVCTIGPASGREEILKQIMLSGMDVARLNFSHGTAESQRELSDTVKKLRDQLNLPIALMLDTKGPEIRIGEFSAPTVELKTNGKFTLTTRSVVGDDKAVSVTFSGLPKETRPGSRILIDDGLIELTVDSKTETDVLCTVVNGGTVSAHKSVNVPGIRLSLPFISEKDRADIAFAVNEDFDLSLIHI